MGSVTSLLTGGLLGGAKASPTPAITPAPAPPNDDAAVAAQSAAAEEERRKRAGSGRASTVLTSPLGDATDSASARRVLLG